MTSKRNILKPIWLTTEISYMNKEINLIINNCQRKVNKTIDQLNLDSSLSSNWLTLLYIQWIKSWWSAWNCYTLLQSIPTVGLLRHQSYFTETDSFIHHIILKTILTRQIVTGVWQRHTGWVFFLTMSISSIWSFIDSRMFWNRRRRLKLQPLSLLFTLTTQILIWFRQFCFNSDLATIRYISNKHIAHLSPWSYYRSTYLFSKSAESFT